MNEEHPQRLDPPFHFCRTGCTPVAQFRKPASLRTGTTSRKPWVASAASPAVLQKEVRYYLENFDHDKPFRHEMPEVTLAKVVCNLRNFYRQDADATVEWIMNYYNEKSGLNWTQEGIRLAWHLSEGFTPSIGLEHKDAKAKQKARILENEVVDLIAWTVPGGRVLDNDLLKVFKEWNPDINVTSHAFTSAVKAVTGLSKKSSHGARYWVGFHLPSMGEQTDSEVAA